MPVIKLVLQSKKEKMFIKWQSQIEPLLTTGGNQ